MSVKVVSGRALSDAQMQELDIERDDFHGEWNYTLKPRRQ